MVNQQRDWVIPPKFTYTSSFSEGLAYVEEGDRCYFLDKTGAVAIELPGLNGIVENFKNGTACVSVNEGRVYINLEGDKFLGVMANAFYFTVKFFFTTLIIHLFYNT